MPNQCLKRRHIRVPKRIYDFAREELREPTGTNTPFEVQHVLAELASSALRTDGKVKRVNDPVEDFL